MNFTSIAIIGVVIYVYYFYVRPAIKKIRKKNDI